MDIASPSPSKILESKILIVAPQEKNRLSGNDFAYNDFAQNQSKSTHQAAHPK